MKKIALCSLILCLCVWLGCSSDDEGPTDPGPQETVLNVVAAAGRPSMTSVEDPLWNSITPLTVSLSAIPLSASSKQPQMTALAVAGSISIQGLVYNDTLYLRFSWLDDTWNRWPDRFEVTELQEVGGDTMALFAQDAEFAKEDQLIVLFQQSGESTWDVWNWRLLTTGAGMLAEGFTYDGGDLVRDAGEVAVATNNAISNQEPIYMDSDPSPPSFDYILLASDAVTLDRSAGWIVEQLLPGWVIDNTLGNPDRVADAGSRFDIHAVSSYAVSPGQHRVVLCRALTTGYPDDLPMVELTDVRVRVGVTNNLDFVVGQGDSDQGFSAIFRMHLP